jgi:group I intron endonuclease
MFKTVKNVEGICIGIYKITSPKGKHYIGQSINIQRRKKQYERLHCKKQSKLFNSLKKYGVSTHRFDIIVICNVEELNTKERYYQEFFNCVEKGLNLKLVQTKDKSGVLSEETKKKISDKLKGENHIYFGRKLPEYHKKILYESIKSRKPLTEEAKQRLSLKLKNRIFSDETILKMSKNNHMSRKVIDTVTQKVYSSVKEVSISHKINYNTLMCKLNENNLLVKNNTNFKYLKNE